MRYLWEVYKKKQNDDPDNEQRLGWFFVNRCIPPSHRKFDLAKLASTIFFTNNVGLCNVLIQEYLDKVSALTNEK